MPLLLKGYAPPPDSPALMTTYAAPVGTTAAGSMTTTPARVLILRPRPARKGAGGEHAARDGRSHREDETEDQQDDDDFDQREAAGAPGWIIHTGVMIRERALRRV